MGPGFAPQVQGGRTSRTGMGREGNKDEKRATRRYRVGPGLDEEVDRHGRKASR